MNKPDFTQQEYEAWRDRKLSVSRSLQDLLDEYDEENNTKVEDNNDDTKGEDIMSITRRFF